MEDKIDRQIVAAAAIALVVVFAVAFAGVVGAYAEPGQLLSHAWRGDAGNNAGSIGRFIAFLRSIGAH